MGKGGGGGVTEPGERQKTEAGACRLQFIPRVVAYLRHQAGACSVEPAQRRVLTNPAEPCRNDGLDNENDDLIMLEEDAFEAPSGRTCAPPRSPLNAGAPVPTLWEWTPSCHAL